MRISGAEALVRWEHPIHGRISPDEFINIAEESNLIEKIDFFVLETVCNQIRIWKELAKPISVNLSPRLFMDENLVDKIQTILTKYQVPSYLIEFEITERTIVADSEVPLHVFKMLSEAGFTLSIDDFGTGYSALSHLSRFPIGVLKIDLSFIKRLCEDIATKNIVIAIIRLADALNIKVIAEGVETAAQSKLLAQLGCQEVQGYYYYKPIMPDKFTDLLSQKVIEV